MDKSALFLSLVLFASPALAQRAKADLRCTHTGTDFVYDCVIHLSPPTPGVQVTVGADMPSMPMAHNVRPVAANATATPGEYAARLTLEMHGDWALRLKVAGPLEDQLVEVLRFTEEGAGPPARKSVGPSGHKH